MPLVSTSHLSTLFAAKTVGVISLAICMFTSCHICLSLACGILMGLLVVKDRGVNPGRSDNWRVLRDGVMWLCD